MEENLARLYADTHVTKQKSKSQLISQKRTFKLAEPNDSNDDAPKWNRNHSNTSTISKCSNSSNNSNNGKRK